LQVLPDSPLGSLKLTCAKTLVKVGRFAQLREPNSYCKSWQRGGSPASCNVVVGEAFAEGDDGEDEHGPVEAKDDKGGQVEVVPEVKITKFYEQLFCQNSFSKKKPNINCKQRKAVESTYAQKADHKMLKKLTLVVNFTNILQAAFCLQIQKE